MWCYRFLVYAHTAHRDRYFLYQLKLIRLGCVLIAFEILLLISDNLPLSSWSLAYRRYNCRLYVAPWLRTFINVRHTYYIVSGLLDFCALDYSSQSVFCSYMGICSISCCLPATISFWLFWWGRLSWIYVPPVSFYVPCVCLYLFKSLERCFTFIFMYNCLLPLFLFSCTAL